MTPQQNQAMKLLVAAIVDSVKAAGSIGAPGGVLYAALMAQGFTLEQYEKLMSSIVRAGVLIRRGDCYFVA